MSDLSTFRDHARAMSTAEHRPDRRCVAYFHSELQKWRMAQWNGPGWGEPDERPTLCPGCVTDGDRALWLRLADEVDAYLTHDEEGLFA